MAPIWGRYGPFFLYGYSVVLGLGVLAALGVTALLARRPVCRPSHLPGVEGTVIPVRWALSRARCAEGQVA